MAKELSRAEVMEQAKKILEAPFPSSKIQWRVGTMSKDRSKGSMLAYIDSRTVASRLDELLAIGVTWCSDFPVQTEKGIVSRITLKLPDGSEVSRENGSEWTDTQAFKGGISGAFKRTGAMFGIGKPLYEMDSPWVKLQDKRFYGKIIIPDRFLPEEERTGNEEMKIEYDESKYTGSTYNSNTNTGTGNTTSQNIPPNVQAAMNFVVATDGYNQGKKIGSIKSEKAVWWLSKNADTDEERKAAETVLNFRKGKAKEAVPNEEVPF